MEVTVPIVYGSISFWLGKKAAEYVFPPLSRFYTSHTCALAQFRPILEIVWLWDLLKLSNNVRSEMALVYATRCNWVPN